VDKEEDLEMIETKEKPLAEVITVYLIKHSPCSSSGLGQSYSLLAPEGYGLDFMRRFVYSSCKAIGAREHMKLMLECG
jgi:hypothetical protein